MKCGDTIKLTNRQEEIVQIVKTDGPLTSLQIAKRLSLTRATLRPDLSILTMTGSLVAKPRVGYSFNEQKHISLQAEKYLKQPVCEWMARPVVINESTSVYDAIVQLFLDDVGTLYTVNQSGHLAGVVSRKDLLRSVMGNQKLGELPVSIIMTRMPNIVFIGPDSQLIEAAKKMLEAHVDSLPVVQCIDHTQNTYKVIGRITKTTITRIFREMAD